MKGLSVPPLPPSQVSDLAQILNAPLREVQAALSVAARLGFATLITPAAAAAAASNDYHYARRSAAPVTMGDLINLESDESSSGGGGDGSGGGGGAVGELRTAASGGDLGGNGAAAEGGMVGGTSGTSGAEGGRAVALLLDAEATSYLMMGALSPGEEAGWVSWGGGAR